MAGSCQHGDEHYDSVKGVGEFLSSSPAKRKTRNDKNDYISSTNRKYLV